MMDEDVFVFAVFFDYDESKTLVRAEPLNYSFSQSRSPESRYAPTVQDFLREAKFASLIDCERDGKTEH